MISVELLDARRETSRLQDSEEVRMNGQAPNPCTVNTPCTGPPIGGHPDARGSDFIVHTHVQRTAFANARNADRDTFKLSNLRTSTTTLDIRCMLKVHENDCRVPRPAELGLHR